MLELHNGDRIILTLRKRDSDTIRVSTLDVDVLGEVSHLSGADPRGVVLGPNRERKLYKFEYQEIGPKGVPVSWPKNLPSDMRGSSVSETMVFLITKDQANLCNLCRKAPAASARGAPSSQLLDGLLSTIVLTLLI